MEDDSVVEFQIAMEDDRPMEDWEKSLLRTKVHPRCSLCCPGLAFGFMAGGGATNPTFTP
eukprot:363988-Chlamydomonas_euryale.AAC.4